jgi:hypothetical protein
MRVREGTAAGEGALADLSALAALSTVGTVADLTVLAGASPVVLSVAPGPGARGKALVIVDMSGDAPLAGLIACDVLRDGVVQIVSESFRTDPALWSAAFTVVIPAPLAAGAGLIELRIRPIGADVSFTIALGQFVRMTVQAFDS